MIAIGSQVFVQWYGSVLQGEVVPNTTPDDRLLGSMVAVRIPLQGSQAIALFTPAHVYLSTDQMVQQEKKKFSYPKEFPKPADIPVLSLPCSVYCDSVATKPQDNLPTTPEAWQRIQAFKAAHWDHEHNRLQLPYWQEFYEMWREAVAEKVGYKEKTVEPMIISGASLTAVMKQVKLSGVPAPEKKAQAQLSLNF